MPASHGVSLTPYQPDTTLLVWQVHRVSQHEMWTGAAQTTSAYLEGISAVCRGILARAPRRRNQQAPHIWQVCHGSSAGQGPCLKRIITVFALPEGHPLAGLSAVQRLLRIGIAVHAIERRHMLQPAPAGAAPAVPVDERAVKCQ